MNKLSLIDRTCTKLSFSTYVSHARCASSHMLQYVEMDGVFTERVATMVMSGMRMAVLRPAPSNVDTSVR
jgi:hypothetical protein